MTKQDKENLKNKKLTDSLLISCLAACEPVISKNAYLILKRNGAMTIQVMADIMLHV